MPSVPTISTTVQGVISMLSEIMPDAAVTRGHVTTSARVKNERIVETLAKTANGSTAEDASSSHRKTSESASTYNRRMVLTKAAIAQRSHASAMQRAIAGRSLRGGGAGATTTTVFATTCGGGSTMCGAARGVLNEARGDGVRDVVDARGDERRGGTEVVRPNDDIPCLSKIR